MRTGSLGGALLLLVAANAAAYELKRDSSGEAVRWPTEAIFVVDAGIAEQLDEPRALEAVEAAGRALEGVAPGLTVALVPGRTEGVGYDFSPGAENQNEIVALDEWPYDEGAIAITVVSVDLRTHAIVDADIALNTASRQFRVLPETSLPGGAFDDLQNALVHELGHALGLAHNPALREAVMYPGARKGEVTKRALTEDDVAGLRVLYPEPRSASLLPTVGCSATGEAGSAQALTVLLPLLALLLARRRGRTRPAPRRGVGPWAPVALLLFATSAQAGEGQRAPARVGEADRVFTAEVVSARPLPPAPGRTVLYTELTVGVRRCVKGPCPAHLTLMVPGGRLGNIEQLVDGLPAPSPGEVLAVTELRDGRVKRQVYRLALSRDFVAFARGLTEAGVRIDLVPVGSVPTLQSPPTPAD